MGSVGIPIPGTTIRVAEDGEILVKGIGVFRGYHANQAANAEAFVDGFFRTGDLGELDAQGFLTVTGRKRDLLGRSPSEASRSWTPSSPWTQDTGRPP